MSMLMVRGHTFNSKISGIPVWIEGKTLVRISKKGKKKMQGKM
jgi:hypothetical protein